MDVKFETIGAALLITITGRLDTASAPDFDRQTAPHLTPPRASILMDMSALTYVSSAGLRSILQLVKHTAAHAGRLGMFALTPQVMEVIEISGFPSLLDIYPGREAALETA